MENLTKNHDEQLFKFLSHNPSLLKTVFDTFSDVLFFIKDLEGRYLWANSTLLTRGGLKSPEEVFGKTADDLFPASGLSTMAQDLVLMQNRQAIQDTLRMYRTAGGARYWCLSSKFPMFDPANNLIGLFGLSRDLPRPNGRHPSYFRLAKFLEYIDSRIGEGVLIVDAARESAISMDTLARLVFDVYHLTPKQLLTKKRIDYACKLLEQTSQSVSDIAAACGYADQSAFSRQFKMATYITPVQYRLTHKPNALPE
jgi:PAS domain S-box-containing protein